jgi:hypothetical protein
MSFTGPGIHRIGINGRDALSEKAPQSPRTNCEVNPGLFRYPTQDIILHTLI